MHLKKVVERRLDEVLRAEGRSREYIKQMEKELGEERKRFEELLEEKNELELCLEEM